MLTLLAGLRELLLRFGQIPGLYFCNGWAEKIWKYLSMYRDRKERVLEVKDRVKGAGEAVGVKKKKGGQAGGAGGGRLRSKRGGGGAAAQASPDDDQAAISDEPTGRLSRGPTAARTRGVTVSEDFGRPKGSLRGRKGEDQDGPSEPSEPAPKADRLRKRHQR